jgi:hypothetical protein
MIAIGACRRKRQSQGVEWNKAPVLPRYGTHPVKKALIAPLAVGVFSFECVFFVSPFADFYSIATSLLLRYPIFAKMLMPQEFAGKRTISLL